MSDCPYPTIHTLSRPQLMELLREADTAGEVVAFNAVVVCLSRRFWVRSDDYVLRGRDGQPLDPQLSAAILRRHRRTDRREGTTP